MPAPPHVIRNIPNLVNRKSARNFKRNLAEAIVRGDLKAVQAEQIPSSWFTTEAFDNHGNRLVAFAAKIALQKHAVSTVGTGIFPTMWGTIFEHVLQKCVARQKSPFVTAKNKTNYNVLHVVADHAKSAADAAFIINKIAQYSGLNKNKLSHKAGLKYNKAFSPGTLASHRGVINAAGTSGVNIAAELRKLKVVGGATLNQGVLNRLAAEMKSKMMLEHQAEMNTFKKQAQAAINAEKRKTMAEKSRADGLEAVLKGAGNRASRRSAKVRSRMGGASLASAYTATRARRNAMTN